MKTETACRIVVPHHASFETYPIVMKGEVVEHLSDDSEYPEWFIGRDSSGREGYLPKDYFQASTGTDVVMMAMRSYNARELTVQANTEATLVETYGGWAYIRIAEDAGWVPLDCISIEVENQSSSSS